MRSLTMPSIITVLRHVLVTALAVGLDGPVGAFAEPQHDSPAAPKMTAVKPLAHVDAREFENVLALLEVEYVVKPAMNVIVLKGRKEAIESALRAIEALDQPQPNLELTAFIVSASKTHDESRGIPDDLRPVVDQLRGVFGYSGFELLDAASLRIQVGRRGTIQGGLALGDPEGRTVARYAIRFARVRIAPPDDSAEGWLIRLDDLTFGLTGDGGELAQLRTDVAIVEGQKAVIGRSAASGIGDSVVLIVDAKILGDSGS
jgi:hypothetical protein